jgi:hypothetical protein
MLELKKGQKIAVYDERRRELGEGTLIRVTRHSEMNMTAYECEEHTILAKGEHFVRAGGIWTCVKNEMV